MSVKGCDSVEGGTVEDVFDMTGRPPKGWMHAIFHGGPYGEDVGRCIPGPPAPATLAVPLAEGGVHMYRLWTVGSWSDPDDPIAVYNPDGPPVPPRLLTAQEKQWTQEGQQRRGLGPVSLIALADDGRMVHDPDAPAIEALLAALQERQHLLLQRLTDHDEGDCYILVLFAEDATYEVEHQASTTGERYRTRSASQTEVRDAVLRWAADQASQRTELEGPTTGDDS
ncbi:hypothetical protein [Streptomyces exfoliatus]|uniref:hypothetical protein n=1 Tax=Streptomyces exfoliatus TaxID=1905 RepID=UPI0012FF2DCD|nr:hypothetical protein [Streptomyces exfoliatus]